MRAHTHADAARPAVAQRDATRREAGQREAVDAAERNAAGAAGAMDAARAVGRDERRPAGTGADGGAADEAVSADPAADPSADPAGEAAGEAGSRWFVLWDAFFAISYAVTALLLLTGGGDQSRRALAIGALTLAVPWYAALGRPLALGRGPHRATGGRGALFAAVLSALFAVAAVCAPASSFALFAVVPMLLMTLPTGPATALAAFANLLPVAVVWQAGGDTSFVLPMSLLGVALSVLLGLWITRVVRQSRERAELIGMLRRSREQLAALSREAGVFAERERLAREIHDTVAQGLTSVISLVEAAEAELDETPQAARRHLDVAGRVARESLAEAREFVAVLTPGALREGSLAAAVRRQADGLAAQTGLAVRCTVDGDERPLPTALGVVLLRAAQEALANVRRHAVRAGGVDVVLRYRPDTVALLVRDDGEGFEQRDDQEGYGLHGMRARAREAGGDATFTSSPGHGTTVEVTVPVKAAEREAAQA